MKCPLNSCKNSCHCLRDYWFIGIIAIVTFIVWLGGFNQSLFLAINARHGILPDTIWSVFNSIASFVWLPILLVIITWLFKREYIFRVIIIVILYGVIFTGLKFLVGEARPFVVLPLDAFYWINLPDSAKKAYESFPSGHAARAGIFVFTLITLFCQNNKHWLRVVLYIFLVAVMFARICTGWHWPLDVLVSCIISYILVKVCLCVCLKGNKNAKN